MTRVDKLKQRFLTFPKDFHWQELIRLMGSFGFVWENPSGGSHGFFRHTVSGLVIKPAARPHPTLIVPVYQLKQYKAKLEEWGML